MTWNDDQYKHPQGIDDLYQPAPVWSEWLVLFAIVLLAVVAIWQGVFVK
jgi:hypothetical protein